MEFGKVGKAVLYSNNREMRRGGESPKLNQDQVVTPVSRRKEVSCSEIMMTPWCSLPEMVVVRPRKSRPPGT